MYSITTIKLCTKRWLTGDILGNLRVWKKSAPRKFFWIFILAGNIQKWLLQRGEKSGCMWHCPQIKCPLNSKNVLFFPELPAYFPEMPFSFPEVFFCFLEVPFCFPEVPFCFLEVPFFLFNVHLFFKEWFFSSWLYLLLVQLKAAQKR